MFQLKVRLQLVESQEAIGTCTDSLRATLLALFARCLIDIIVVPIGTTRFPKMVPLTMSEVASVDGIR